MTVIDMFIIVIICRSSLWSVSIWQLLCYVIGL